MCEHEWVYLGRWGANPAVPYRFELEFLTHVRRRTRPDEGHQFGCQVPPHRWMDVASSAVSSIRLPPFFVGISWKKQPLDVGHSRTGNMEHLDGGGGGGGGGDGGDGGGDGDSGPPPPHAQHIALAVKSLSS